MSQAGPAISERLASWGAKPMTNGPPRWVCRWVVPPCACSARCLCLGPQQRFVCTPGGSQGERGREHRGELLGQLNCPEASRLGCRCLCTLYSAREVNLPERLPDFGATSVEHEGRAAFSGTGPGDPGDATAMRRVLPAWELVEMPAVLCSSRRPRNAAHKASEAVAGVQGRAMVGSSATLGVSNLYSSGDGGLGWLRRCFARFAAA
jgi:hypothetical protein